MTGRRISDKGAADFITMIAQYQGITELTAATVNALIDKITVSERRKNKNGETEQEIRIYYKFVGLLHERYIAPPKRTCHMEEKTCFRCGGAFIPGSNAARYCPACRAEMAKEYADKSNEARKAKRHAMKAFAISA